MLQSEGFSGDLVSNSSELDAITRQLDKAQLSDIYHLVHNSPPDHFFDFTLRNDIEHLVLSGTNRVFYLNEDQAFRLSNPNDVLWSPPVSIEMNFEDPIATSRHKLAEELGRDIVKRWANKDAEDYLHLNRFALWRECYEAADVSV